jgi:hypothetical protein
MGVRIARCDNYREDLDEACTGRLHFQPDDLEAPCDTCGARCGRLVASYLNGDDAWRESREPGWYRDVGYALQDALRLHLYDYRRKGEKPDDPGWHECTCGTWQGYWSGWQPHVADHLRDVALGLHRHHART